MPSFVRRWWPLVLITMLALWLRTHDLAQRPMHADEANQAVKTGELLEHGRYTFDPRDHHGPTLYYAALPIAWVRGERTLAQLSETTVRLLPALFGTLTVGLIALLGTALASDAATEIGRGHPPGPNWPAMAAATLAAVSPPAVYYSRYFVQETLLVAFLLATVLSARAWWRTGRLRWAIAAGIAAGLMQATKASAALFLVAAVTAAVATGTFPRSVSGGGDESDDRNSRRKNGGLTRAVFAAAIAAVATAALLYSSFGANPRGLSDALAVYANAFTRLSGGETGHEKPWWYYWRLFAWQRDGGLVWQQLGFLGLAVAGFVIALFRRDPFLRAVALYTAIVTIALSLVPYKTPWHAIHFVPGFALLSAAALAAIARLRTGKFVALPAMLLIALMQLQQTRQAAFLRPADPRNPYAYVHSSPDVLKFRALADAARRVRPTAPIRVISEEYWPLPWYLRGLPDVGYWSTPPADCDGALVIASAGEADIVRLRLHGAYRESFLGLRPGFVCVVFTPET